jgi:hypothetical protein
MQPVSLQTLLGVTPNFVVERSTHLLRIWEIPGSNLSPGDRISWLRFSWISSVPPDKFRDSTLKLCHYRFLPNPFQFINIHLSQYHRRYVALLLKKRCKINCQVGSSNIGCGDFSQSARQLWTELRDGASPSSLLPESRDRAVRHWFRIPCPVSMLNSVGVFTF